MGLSLAPRLQCTVVVARDVDGSRFRACLPSLFTVWFHLKTLYGRVTPVRIFVGIPI